MVEVVVAADGEGEVCREHNITSNITHVKVSLPCDVRHYRMTDEAKWSNKQVDTSQYHH